MTYNQYIEETATTILCEFTMSSDQVITSTTGFGDVVNIGSVSGSSDVTLSSNVITLPQGYEFIVRFFIGIERASTTAEVFTKIQYSDATEIDGVTVSEIGGDGNNKSSLEDSSCTISTPGGQKSFHVVTYKTTGYTTTILSDYTWGLIIGVQL